MKKRLVIFSVLIGALSLSGCTLGGNRYYENVIATDVFGYGNIKPKDYNGLIYPFSTVIQLIRYQKNRQFDDITDDFLFHFQNLHAHFDSNYEYTIDNEDINNLKTINENYGNGEFIKVSEELFDILKTAVEITKISKGKFNVAIGSLTSLWDGYIKIGQQQENFVYQIPSETEIEEALSAVPNMHQIGDIIEFNEFDKSIRINPLQGAKDPVSLTLGAIGKGYAVKKMEEKLKDEVTGYINGGESSIATLSSSPFGNWNLALTNPLYQEYRMSEKEDYTKYNFAELRLKKDGIFSFSTSGNSNRFYYGEDGNVYHHIIDATTGIPSNYFKTVSVICSDSTYADAITTALMAMNLEEGKQFVLDMEERFDIDVYPIWTKKIDNTLYVIADNSLINELSLDRGDETKEYITTLEFIELNR